ncbi:hypothetical protein MLD38_039902 [Melastoma candidum]|uniref:Uncharacterized protein n=1 Tax=Melastoma candidum TaxID=119954 RepID=A0ACB9L405_9MYRT|nr:hypothetical protein MLD38_039902 [Melastoma candidum]
MSPKSRICASKTCYPSPNLVYINIPSLTFHCLLSSLQSLVKVCQHRLKDQEGSLNPSFVETITCSSCGHGIKLYNQCSIRPLPGLPVGVKFDPSDQEILEHLEAKVLKDTGRMHPLIDEFIPTLEGQDGICSMHPEKLPGLSRDGQVRHFFHCPLRAYSTGTRKQRKVQKNPDGSKTRWHKTGHSRPILVNGTVKGFKKILALYTNFGKLRRPEKENWIMHQYHLGSTEEERDGELVVSKVFYQTRPRQCGSSSILVHDGPGKGKTSFRDVIVTDDSRPGSRDDVRTCIHCNIRGIQEEGSREKGVPKV